MANLTFSAFTPAGHLAVYDLLGRGVVSLDLQNASYNNVKVYPVGVTVSNAGNDGAVTFTYQNGMSRSIAARVNESISCAGNAVVTINNTGRRPIKLFVYDAAAMAAGGANLAASDQSTAGTNDYVFHFDGATADLGVNSGIEKQGSVTVDPLIVAATANTKFGASCMQIVNLGDQMNVFNASFFDVTKEFTFDFWIRKNAAAPGSGFFALDLSGQIQVREIAADGISLFINPNTTNSAAGVLPAGGAPKHLALTMKDNVWRVFVNGVAVITVNNPSLAALPSVLLDGFRVGDFGFNAVRGWYDELRYTKGTAQWIKDFTPPTEPYF